MQNSRYMMTAGVTNLPQKLVLLAGMLLFVCILYLILPKMMNHKIKGYHEQCELDEAEDNEIGKEEAGEDKNEI